mmetsp:Transcript_5409/g.16072  ORF Transcript_5409/g.16072 Transcript_5409/m.16072 type:complete len:202 (-) Transcript_5409:805-1410(-)
MPSPPTAQIALSGLPALPMSLVNPTRRAGICNMGMTSTLHDDSCVHPTRIVRLWSAPQTKNCSKNRRAAPNTPASQVNSLGCWVSPASQVKSNHVCWDLRRCVQLSHIPVLASSRTSSERRPRLTPAGRVLEKVRELQLWRNGSPAVEPRVQLDPLGLVGLDISNGRQRVIKVPGSPFHLAVRRLRKVGDPVRRSLHELRG